jgi:ankyrin repeat protein
VASSSKSSDFYLACRYNNIKECKKLLETMTLDEMDRIEPNGSTALHVACYNDHAEIVKLY